MKLAEALAERSDCQNRIEEMKKRLIRSARVQEGEQPAEDTTELLAETERTFARLLELVSAINRTNAKTAFDNGRSISDAIAERDVVGKRRDFLAGIAEAGKHPAGSLLQVGGAICLDRVGGQAADGSGSVRKAVS